MVFVCTDAQYSHRTVSAQVQHRQRTVSHAHLKDAEEALVEIEATLGESGIKWKKNGVMDIMCTDEVRVCSTANPYALNSAGGHDRIPYISSHIFSHFLTFCFAAESRHRF